MRVFVAVLVSVSLGLASVLLWSRLKDHSEAQVARVAEADSWAARAQLVRSSETFLSALHGLRIYWESQAGRPRADWADQPGVDTEVLDRVGLIVWHDPDNGTRFSRTLSRPVLDHRPDDAEWAAYAPLVARAIEVTEDSFVGPYAGDDGAIFYEAYLVSPDASSRGRLVALFDAGLFIGGMLADQSPGYAVRIYAHDMLLFARGEPVANAPPEWVREGMIRPAFGPLWRVVHVPTDAFVSSMNTLPVDSLLLLGAIIAVLVGTLLIENGRARSRAAAAESAEAALGDLNRDLEATVQHRTRQLEERSADLQMLTDSVAHDMRNPLNTISVNTQLLEEVAGERLGEDGQRILGRMMPSVQHMAGILDRLVGLSQATHATFERTKVDMQALAEDVIAELVAAEATPTPEVRIDPLPAALADRTLVELLWVNLLGNALKYTRGRDPRQIHIGAVQNGDNPVWFVRDNGVGFRQDDADSVFEAFNRLGSSSTADGVGLGLTIAARVVDRHGGQIRAEGKLDEGASFYFSLGEQGNTP